MALLPTLECVTPHISHLENTASSSYAALLNVDTLHIEKSQLFIASSSTLEKSLSIRKLLHNHRLLAILPGHSDGAWAALPGRLAAQSTTAALLRHDRTLVSSRDARVHFSFCHRKYYRDV